MSKFIEQIKAEFTGRERPYAARTQLQVNVDMSSSPEFGLARQAEYDIGVKWGRKVFCRPEDLRHAITAVARELVEEIYGDLRSRLIEIERIAYENGSEKMLPHIRDIIREINV